MSRFVLDVLGADPQARDASRVLRLVGTVNTKSNEICRVVHVEPGDDGQPLKYDFERLCENLLPVARWDIETNRLRKQARRKALQSEQEGRRTLRIMAFSTETAPPRGGLQNLTGARLAWDRLSDLRKLAELRGGIFEGERMQHLFWQMNFLLLSGATHSSQMWYESAELARQIDPAWNCRTPELSTLYHKAKAFNAGEKVTFKGIEYPPLYTPWNSRLIELFRITGGEQKQLKTIISKDEKAVREKARDAKRKGWQQSRAEYEGQAEHRRQTVMRLKSQGFRYAYIAEKLGISVDAVKGLVKRAKASDTKA